MSDLSGSNAPERGRRTGGLTAGFGASLLGGLFALPILCGLAIRLAMGGDWFRDLDALTCASWRVANQLSPYGAALACPSGRPTDYMYLPQLAALLAPFSIGPSAAIVRGLLIAAVVVSIGYLLWALVLRRTRAAPHLSRAAILPLTTGGALTCANLAFTCHALVLGLALARRRGPTALIVAIVAVSALKPIFLTYLLIFAYEDQPLWGRARRIGAGIGAAGLVALIVLATGGRDLVAWRDALGAVALRAQPGYGFLGWLDAVGVGSGAPSLALYLIFAPVLCLAGLAIAEFRRLDGKARMLLAVGVAQLANPRLMAYDLIMLAPLAVAFCSGTNGARQPPGWALLAFGLAASAVFLTGSDLAQRLGPPTLAVALIVAGARAAGEGLVARPRRSLRLAARARPLEA